jgi:transcription antitermination protein NusB
MVRRSRAREVALQLLFQRDQNSTLIARPAIEKFVRDRLLADPEMVAYCLALYDGTLAKQAEIDPKLTATAANWRLSRMHPADRNVLRLATYELLYDPAGQPLEVIIHEANELAARFGSAESARFVNGVLDKVAKSRSEGEGDRGEVKPEASPAAE